MYSNSRSSYHVLIPHLVFLNDFEEVKSIGAHLDQDWKQLLANCFPKLMVNILPHFALAGQDTHVAQQREKAHRVYDILKNSNCLGKQVRMQITADLHLDWLISAVDAVNFFLHSSIIIYTHINVFYNFFLSFSKSTV